MKKEIKIQRAIDFLKGEGYEVIPPPSSFTKEVVLDADPLEGYPLREELEIWLAYKKEKKQSYKPMGLKSCMRDLMKNTDGNHEKAMEAIEFSMSKNYSGIFYPKRNGADKKLDAIRNVALAEAEANKAAMSGGMEESVPRPF